MTIRIVLAFLTGLAALPCCRAEAPAEKGPKPEEVTLSVFQPDGDSACLPHLVALDKGYFREAGIELSVINLKDPVQESTSTLTDPAKAPAADIYLLGRSHVYATEALKPGVFKVFNINVQHKDRWNDALLAPKSLGLKSISGLDPARPIGIVDLGGARVEMIKIILKKNGLKPEDFTFLPVYNGRIKPDPAEAMPEPESTGLLYAREPFKSILLQRGDWEAILDEPLFAKNILSPWPMSMTVFSARFLRERPAAAARIEKAYSRALAFIREEPGQAQKILSAYVEKVYGAKGLKPGLCDYLTAGQEHIPVMQRQSDWYAEKGLISGKIKAAALLYSGKPEEQPGKAEKQGD